MIPHVSLFTLAIIGFSVVGLFFILKCFALPQSFYRNQTDREHLLRRKIRMDERKIFKMEEEEDLESEESGEVLEDADQE